MTGKTPSELFEYSLVMILGVIGLIENGYSGHFHLLNELKQTKELIHKALDQCEKCEFRKGVNHD